MAGAFGETFRAWRCARGLSQDQLAAELGVAQTTVSNWERGAMPAGRRLGRIAVFFGCSTVLEFLRGPEAD